MSSVLSHTLADQAYIILANAAGMHTFNNKRKQFRAYKWYGWSVSDPAMSAAVELLKTAGIPFIQSNGDRYAYIPPSITIRVPIDHSPPESVKLRAQLIKASVDKKELATLRRAAVNALAQYTNAFIVQTALTDDKYTYTPDDVATLGRLIAADAAEMVTPVIERLLTQTAK